MKMSTLRHLAAAMLVFAAGLRLLAAEPVAAPSTIVFVTRHAEKASPTEKDPGLSPEGLLRAQALARLLGAAGVTHLATTEYRRTRETVAPLAEALNLEPQVFEAAHIDELVRWLGSLPAGSIAVVAGHSNTVPAIVHGLGGELAGEALDEADYGRLFQVIRPADGRVQVLELRCGS